jgi:hypothetical protein
MYEINNINKFRIKNLVLMKINLHRKFSFQKII